MCDVMMVDTYHAMNRTDRDVLQALEAQWDAYRRTLRAADQVAFDRLFEHAQAHASASSAYAAASEEHHHHQYIERAALVSMLIEQQQHIADLEDRLDHLEADLNDER